MDYKVLWQKVFDKQSEILTKELDNEDTNAQKAAEDIIRYRKQLIDKNVDVDVITLLSVSEAKRMGNSALGLGLDYRGEPYCDLASLLKVDYKIFKEAGVVDEEYMDMIFEVQSRQAKCKDI